MNQLCLKLAYSGANAGRNHHKLEGPDCKTRRVGVARNTGELVV